MKHSIPDTVELAQTLIRQNTCNPPGNEEPIAKLMRDMLAQAGFSTELHYLAPGRPSLIARLPGKDETLPPLVLCGHTDTVPVGAAQWTHPPFSGLVQDGKLHGRGAADMKAGVAAMVAAAVEHAARPARRRGLSVILTASEENGCVGAHDLARRGVLGQAHAVVVGEPTNNQPRLGHKGVLWVRINFQGVAAHGAMPQLGSNAIVKAARAVVALSAFFGDAPHHPQLGRPTSSINVIGGSHKTNVVPDNAHIEMDLRPLPGMDQDDIIRALHQAVPDTCEISVLSGQPGVWTDEGSRFSRSLFQIVEHITGKRPHVDGISYFTDASALLTAFGPVPTIICGPGDPEVIHKPNEWCGIRDILQARDIYSRICEEWTA